jgi:hypothetical protein
MGVTWECSESEIYSLVRELEGTIVSVGCMNEKLAEIPDEVVARAIAQYEQMRRDVARVLDPSNRLRIE